MTDDGLLQTLLKLENAALDRWTRGDTLGYAESLAEDATYFDHATTARLHGLQAVREHLGKFHGTFSIPRHEIVNPAIHRDGDLAVLAFNWEPYGDDGQLLARWNATSVYQRRNREWRIVHAQWAVAAKG